MLSYWLKLKQDTESKNPLVAETNKRKNNTFIKMCGI